MRDFFFFFCHKDAFFEFGEDASKIQHQMSFDVITTTDNFGEAFPSGSLAFTKYSTKSDEVYEGLLSSLLCSSALEYGLRQNTERI